MTSSGSALKRLFIPTVLEMGTRWLANAPRNFEMQIATCVRASGFGDESFYIVVFLNLFLRSVSKLTSELQIALCDDFTAGLVYT